MRQATSPTWPKQSLRPARLLSRFVVVGALVLGLVAVSSPVSSADDLYDQRDKVRKSIAQTKDQIAKSKKAVATASANLSDSKKQLSNAQTQLATAQAEFTKAQGALDNAKEKLATANSALSKARAELADAKTRDAEMAAKLQAAQDELAAAIARVAQGEVDLVDQQKLIGGVVRTAYQQQSNLVTFAILMDASTAGQVADRMQWTDLIFGSTTNELSRLEQLQVELEAAKVARTEAEAKVTAQKHETEAQLAQTQALTNRAADLANQQKQLTAQAKELSDDAAAKQATVESLVKKVKKLVDKNRKTLDAAEDELETTKEQYDKQQAQEAAISKQIQAQIAKDKANNNQRINSMGFVRPIDATPGSPFGMRYHPILHYWRMHWGQDFGAKCGAPIWAMADGKVTQILTTARSNGLGNWTVIDYGKYKGDSFSSGYAHQSKIIVKVGQEVKQGQIVGYVGTTGLSTGCHLHLQIYKNGVRVNPRPYV